MSYDIDRSFEPDEPNLVLEHNSNLDPVADGEEPAGELEFFIRPLNGKDDIKINDRLIKLKKGSGDVQAGTTEMLKVTRSVTRVRGLVRGGEPVHKIGEETYGKLKTWVLDALKAKVREINAESDEDADQE